MLKKFFKRLGADSSKVKESKNFQRYSYLFKHAYLFHFNRHSISKALGVGLFLSFMPIPMQMLVAMWISLLVRANLPLAVATVWVSNPVTIPFMLLAAYQTGSLILGTPLEVSEFQWSADFFATTFQQLWKPIMTGCLVLGTLLGLAGYGSVQLLWRLHIIRYWKERKERKHKMKVANRQKHLS